MNVELNGQLREVGDATSVRELVVEYAGEDRGVAVALDGTVFPRDRWDESVGDLAPRTIDVLTAVQGG
ncbi:sulfur carrier protein ThiS [Corynebacterium sp.]|uniref:sulfur carrier protein ThiS n=1 Tax=Corynebacterium sp. TaxID=1720 RepID=UPI0026DAB0A3|nr:sulfur carrier protein ThiS [Corynebacterium sp.]MDO5076821.1 sulfur carrier protein ThiS [Corynebacterium sp.]